MWLIFSTHWISGSVQIGNDGICCALLVPSSGRCITRSSVNFFAPNLLPIFIRAEEDKHQLSTTTSSDGKSARNNANTGRSHPPWCKANGDNKRLTVFTYGEDFILLLLFNLYHAGPATIHCRVRFCRPCRFINFVAISVEVFCYTGLRNFRTEFPCVYSIVEAVI